MKKVSLFATVIIISSLLLLPGCSSSKFRNAGDLTYFSYFYTESVETDMRYSYLYDYYFEVFADEQMPEQVIISLRIDRNIEPSLSYVVQGSSQNLADIREIIESQNIYKWNGDTDAPFSSASRVEFSINAVFEDFELTATNNYPGIPAKYVQGHEVLSSYLIQCIETLPPHRPAEEDLLRSISITLPEKDGFFVYDSRYTIEDDFEGFTEIIMALQ